MKPFVGQSLERLEDDRLLRGEATFVDDIMLDDMIYLAVFRSPIAHGRIIRVDLTRAKEMNGVVAAFAGADFDALPKIPLRLAPVEGVARFLQRPIARDKVRYVGEPIAVVLATTPELAEDALELIDIEIDQLQPVVDWATASTPGALLFEENNTNVTARYTVSEGDMAKAFAAAAYTRRETFYCHRHTALPMETRGLVAVWDETDNRMRIEIATNASALRAHHTHARLSEITAPFFQSYYAKLLLCSPQAFPRCSLRRRRKSSHDWL